ncbi:MAG: gliding motility-associated C-terminal domain-containing protein [Bacteroidetes bacterium]|nr:gliding motility-associated C-terminal domain-containing protein [Bacteroidota bacterium]
MKLKSEFQLENPPIKYILLIIVLHYLVFQTICFSQTAASGGTSVNQTACATVNVPLTAYFCNGGTIPATNFTSTPAGATFTWTNSNPSIGIPASGVGDIPAIPAVNLTASTIVASITVTPHIGACNGIPSVYTIYINPVPTAVLQPLTQTEYCFGDTVKMTVNLTGKFPLAFFMNNHARLYSASSAVKIVTETLVGTHSFFFGATDYVYDVPGCSNTNVSGSVNFIIRPAPSATVSGNDSACFGATKNIKIDLTGTAPWYITYDSAGLGPVTIKRYTTPVYIPVSAIGTWKYTVTSVADSFCTKASNSFATIKIKALPSIAPLTNQTVCAGASSIASSFATIPAGGTFSWTNSLTSIGLPASGSGNVPSFVAVNSGATNVVSTIAVSPILAGCAGTSSNYTITVSPMPTFNVPANQSVCNGTVIPASSLSSVPAGASYTWTNSNTAIGLAASGSGNVPAFTASNLTTSSVIGTITVTPQIGVCTGTASSYTITLQPTPALGALSNHLVCSDATVPVINFSSTPAGGSFSWNTATTSIGIAASGVNSIPSFTAINAGTTSVTSSINVSVELNGCIGNTGQFDITVKPKPQAVVPANSSHCSGATVAAVSFSSTPVGATYTWTNNLTAIGLGASGSGNVSSFIASNLTAAAHTGTISVTPTLNGCIGDAGNYTITVAPKATVVVPANQTVCDGGSVNATSLTSVPPGATYTWTNSNTSIGLAAGGNGDVPTFLGTNPSSSLISGTITVTPTIAGCVGTSSNYTISVKARPMAIVPANQTYCDGATVAAINFTSSPPGATYGWFNNDPSIGTAGAGSNSIPAFTASNSGTSTVTATIEVAAIVNGCMGPNVPFNISLKPSPSATVPANQTVCPGTVISASSFSSTPAGATYTWSNTLTSIGLAASGIGNVPTFTTANSGATSLTASIVVTPTLNGCVGAGSSYDIIVKPSPILVSPANQTVCDGASTSAINLSSSPTGASFAWANSNTATGLAVSGNGNIASFIASNSGSTAISSNITITPTLNSCVGANGSITITVNPKPTVNPPSNQSICDGTTVSAPVLTSVPTGATYTWNNSNTSIGLAASGSGIVPSFVASNPLPTGISGTISLTPTLNGCVGNVSTYTITVDAKPVAILPADQTVCDGQSISASAFSSNPPGANYSWTNSNTSIGIVGSGSGNLPTFTAINSGTTQQISTITVVPAFGGCSGTASSYSITVNPKPTPNLPANISVCEGASVAQGTLSSNPSGATFSWSNNNTSIGLAASGNGNVPAFISGASGTALVSVTATLAGCVGLAQNYSITVSPQPQVTVPSNQQVCNGDVVASGIFSSNPAGATYTWTNSNSTIGLGASGNNNIPSFTALNSGTGSITSTISVVPTLSGCAGNAQDYTITIKPSPLANVPSNQAICDGANVPALNFSSTPSGATFTWINSNSAIGLGASGIGSISTFTATNSGSSSQISTITVTPTLNGCLGNTNSFSIDVHPLPSFTIPTNQSICGGSIVAASNLISVPSGATFNWTNSTTSIGLAANGTGNIPSFTAINNGTSSVTATISITPILNGCSGNTDQYIVTVNPEPSVSLPANQTVCDGVTISTGNFTSTPVGATYSWTNSNPSIGLAASGTGTTPSFTSSNTGSTVQTANITVTPSIGGCVGQASSYSLIVNPSPTVISPANQSICSGTTSAPISFSSNPSGATFNWTNTLTSIGLAANGTGNIPSFTTQNSGSTSLSSTIQVVPTLNGCSGNSGNFTITILPIPSINALSNQVVCDGAGVASTLPQSSNAGTTFSWTNSNTGIGLTGAGSSTIPAFTAVNTGSAITTANIVVTPSLNGCDGNAGSYTITVNPLPQAILPSSQVVCDGASVASSVLSSNPSGASYSWTNSLSTIGLPSSGTGNIPGFVANNITSGLVAATITVVPSLNGCSGNSSNYTITVNPVATVSLPANIEICAGSTVAASNFISVPSGAVFSWTNSDPSIGLSSSGNGNITSFTAINAGLSSVTATLSILPTYNGCPGTSGSYTVKVKPIPSVSTLPNISLCSGALSSSVNFSSTLPGSTFNWTNSNSTIGLAASGTGSIPAFTSSNTGANPVIAAVQVTAELDACQSAAQNFNITVQPLPQVQPINPISECAGTTVAAVSLTSLTSGTTFTWTNDLPAIGMPASGNGNPLSFVSTNSGTSPLTATITVIPTYQSCVGASENYTISIQPTPVMTAIANQSFCEGQLIGTQQFSSSVTGSSYSWSNTTPAIGLPASGNDSLPSFVIQNASASVLSSTIQVTPTSGTGCIGSATSFTISSLPAPVVQSVATISSCVGTLVPQINFTSTPSGATYTWTNSITDVGIAASGTGSINSFTANNTTSSIDSALISITPSLNGCAGAIENFYIVVQPLATVQVPSDTLVCSGALMTALNLVAKPTGASYSWVNDNTTIGLVGSGTAAIPSFTASNTSGVQKLSTLTITPSFGACKGTVSTYQISVNTMPQAAFSFSPEDATLVIPEISFFDESLYSDLYTWDFGDGESSFDKTVKHSYKDTGCYIVSLLTITNEGCRDSVSHIVCIKDEFHVYIPDAFTPNGDGLNDVFIPVGIGFQSEDYEMTIYNRKSTQIFKSTELTKGWNGKSNLLMIDDTTPMDTYVYKIRCKDMGGKFHFFTGQINLLR